MIAAMVDIYMRNPEPYITQLQEHDVRLVSWDIGNLKRYRTDPLKFLGIYLGNARPWKLLVVAVEGVAEYNETSKSIDRPAAVYPAWHKEQGIRALEDYCANPVGEREELTNHPTLDGRFKPVKGQPHKVVIYTPPNANAHEGTILLRDIRALKSKYAHLGLSFILHDTSSFRMIFGTGTFEGACVDPRMYAKLGGVLLVNGQRVTGKEFDEYHNWIRVLGYRIRDLERDLDARVSFNMDALAWAKRYYLENVNFRLAATQGIDMDSPDASFKLDEARKEFMGRTSGGAHSLAGAMKPGDGVQCNTCSLAGRCKFYRKDAVCSVSGSTSKDLIDFFGTRDSGLIIDGLLRLTEIQAERVEQDLEVEEELGERLQGTDKRIRDLFDSGTKVAKLIDPALAKPSAVNVGVIGATPMGVAQTPQELMASAVKALEANGVPRDEITPKMIRGVLEGVADAKAAPRVIEGEMNT